MAKPVNSAVPCFSPPAPFHESKENSKSRAWCKKTKLWGPIPRKPIENQNYFRTLAHLNGTQSSSAYQISCTAQDYLLHSEICQKAKEEERALFCVTTALDFYQFLSRNYTQDHLNEDLFDRMISCHQRIHVLKPNEPPFQLVEAHMLKAKKKRYALNERFRHWSIARDLCQKILLVKPMNYSAQLLKGRCSLKLGMHKEAFVEFSNALVAADSKRALEEARFYLNQAKFLLPKTQIFIIHTSLEN